VSHSRRVEIKRVKYDDPGFDKHIVSNLRPPSLADRPRLHGKRLLLNFKFYSLFLAASKAPHNKHISNHRGSYCAYWL
jgi:hypothetical protein